MPDEKSFMETIIPKVVRKGKLKIEELLRQATSITLLIDLWVSKQMIDFMGTCAALIFPDMSRKLIVIGIERMLGDGHHNAENIGLTLEKIVNQYSFNKNKIKGVICDERAALVKLLKQIFNSAKLNDGEEVNDDILEYVVEENENENDSSIQSIKEFDNDNEIQEILEDIKPLENLNIINDNEIEEIQNLDEHYDEDDNNEYDLTSGHELIDQLHIVVGSNRYPRFSCANHKINIVIRKTIKLDAQLLKIVKKLTKFSSHTHQSVVDSQAFKIKKNRLRSENITRWSSTFLLLLSFYKAYEKNIFNEVHQCPVSRQQIEFYLILLLPLYKFTLYHQRNSANIGSVVPSVQSLILKYEKMAADRKKKQFCNNLIKNLKKKFDHELNSNLYAVATLLEVGRIREWSNRPFAEGIKTKALSSIPEVGDEMLQNRNDPISTPNSGELRETEAQASTSSDSLNRSFDLYFGDSSEDETKSPIISKKVSLTEELKRFKYILNNINHQKIESKKFWKDNKSSLPLLYELWLILRNISSSSAYVERFFSICGIVNRKRAGNMSDETLINRSFLKANINLLNDIAT